MPRVVACHRPAGGGDCLSRWLFWTSTLELGVQLSSIRATRGEPSHAAWCCSSASGCSAPRMPERLHTLEEGERYGASHPDSTPPSATEPNPQDMSLSLSLPAHDGRDPSLRVTALPRDHVKCAQAVVQAPTEALCSPDKEDKETP